MKTRCSLSLRIVAVTFLFAVSALWALGQNTARSGGRAAATSKPTPMPVVSWKSSTRALTESTTIEVRFPTAMIGENEAGVEVEAGEGPVLVTPALKGRWAWRSANSGVFVVGEDPVRGASYTFSVKPGITDVLGQPLPPQPSFTQRAAGLMMTHRNPTWFPYSNAPRVPRLILQFNDKINLASAQKGLVFRDANNRTVKANVRLATYSDLSGEYVVTPLFRQRALTLAGVLEEGVSVEGTTVLPGTLVVSPVNPLPAGEEWHLIIEGVAGMAPNVKLEDEQRIKIGDVQPLKIGNAFESNEIGEPKRIYLYFNKPLAEGTTEEEVLKRVKVSPVPEDMQLKLEGDESAPIIAIRGAFEHETPYMVSVAGGLKSADGLTMTEPFEESFIFRMIQPTVALPAFIANQMGSGRGVFDIRSVNLSQLRVQVKAADRDSLIDALKAYRSYFTGKEGEPERTEEEETELGESVYHRIPFESMPGRLVYEETLSSIVALDNQDHFVVDWKKALDGQTAGALFISVEGEAKPEWTGSKRRYGAQAFVQVTDISLAWKLTPSELFVFAFSLSSGQPLSGVTLRALDEEGRTLASTPTAADGTAKLTRHGEAWLMAEKGADLHAIEIKDDAMGLGMWRFGVSYEWDPPKGDSRLATLFTERPVYLPGHTVYFKAISRFVDGAGVKLPQPETAKLRAYDAKGRLFYEREITLSPNGTYDGALELPANGPLGSYCLELVFPPLPGQAAAPGEESEESEEEVRARNVFTQHFLVEEYKPNTFQIAFDGENFQLDGEKAILPLSARYLLGKPLSQAKLSWTAQVNGVSFYSKALKDYNFLDSRRTYYWDEEGYHDVPEEEMEEEEKIMTGQARTELSDQGQATLEFTVPAAAFGMRPREIVVRAEVTDINQQTITESWRKTLHSSDFYLGIRQLKSVTASGEPVSVELVAASAENGEPWQQPVDARIKVEKVDFITVRLQTAGVGSNVRTETRRSVVAEGSVRVLPYGQDTPAFKWTPEKPGFYYITALATDTQGRDVESVTSLQVYGESWATWEDLDGVKIDLAPDKTSYRVGETAKILVKSPVTGQALVTVERRGVMAHFLTEITSNAQAIEVPIEPSYAPNVFVSVFIVRGAEQSPKKHRAPEYKFGITELQVNDTSTQLQVAIAPGQPAYRPGDEGTAVATVKDGRGQPVAGAEVTFWAVDDGVLTLLRYVIPDLWTEFHRSQPLAVLTGTTLMEMLAESYAELAFANKGYVIGGGGLELMSEKLRKNFQPVAFWKGALTTDASGQVAVKFTVPDNLTRFRLIAVAVAGSASFGAGESHFEVNKPLMIEPVLPRFAHVGDQITVKGLVMNNTEQPLEAEVSLKLDGKATTEQPLTHRVSLAAHETRTVSFPVTFTEVGEAKWVWAVQAPNLADEVESTLAVNYAQPVLRELHYAALSDPTAEQNLLRDVNPELLEGRGEITLTLANSTLAELRGALAFLLHYPYGCAEQTASTTLFWLALQQLGDVLPDMARSPEEIQQAIQKGAMRLLSMQTSNGGLAYWPGSTPPELWISAYGGLVLALAQKAGADLPAHRLQQLASYLSTALRNTASVHDSYELYNRAFACYALTLLGAAEPAYHDVLAKKLNRLPHPGRALLALAILDNGGTREEAQRVLDDPLDPDLEKWTGNLFDSRLTALNLFVWLKLDPKDRVTVALTERLLQERTPRGDWGSTFNNAWAVLALVAETEANAKNLQATALTVSFAGRQEQVTLPAKPATQVLRLPFTGQATERELTITGHGGQAVRAAIEVAARPKLQPVEPRTVGISIKRKYEKVAPNGTLSPATELEVGDLVAVTLDLDIPQRLRYLAVDDALPAVFEAINPKFKSQVQTAAPVTPSGGNQPLPWWSSFEELRHDRALFFANEIWSPGRYQIRYLARVTAEGTVTVPPARVEAMYNPEKYGLSGTERLTVRPARRSVAEQ